MMCFWNGSFNPGCIFGCCFPFAVRAHRHSCLWTALGEWGTPDFPTASLSLALQEAILASRPGILRVWVLGSLYVGLRRTGDCLQRAPGWPILSSISHCPFPVGEVRFECIAWKRGKKGLPGSPCDRRAMWELWVLCLVSTCGGRVRARSELSPCAWACSVSDGCWVGGKTSHHNWAVSLSLRFN